MASEAQCDFAHSYTARILDEWPPASDDMLLDFHRAGTRPGQDGCLVTVTPEKGARWIGKFAFGMGDHRGLKGVWSTPDPRVMLVVSSGWCVMVDAESPGRWMEAPVFPVTQVHSVPDQALLILVGQTDIAAVSGMSIRWQTKRLAWDEITIDKIEGNTIFGTSSDPTTASAVPFRVDMTTGRHFGGSSPERYGL